MRYHICFFSATGNTAHCVDRIAASLEENGHSVKTLRINSTTRPLSDTPDVLVIACPTLAFQPPALVLRFIRRLPNAGGIIRAAVLAVAGGGAKAAPWTTARALEKRGYHADIVACADYPDNWTQVFPPKTGAGIDAMVRNGDRMLDSFIAALLDDSQAYLAPKKAAYSAAAALGKLFLLIGRRFLGKTFIADSDCTSCGLCARVCPSHTIRMKPRGTPFWNMGCEACNRCINICPQNAINTSLFRISALLFFVAASCIAGFRFFGTWAAPWITTLPGSIQMPLTAIGRILVIAAGHILPLAVLDPLVLRPIQNTGLFRKYMPRSFTKGFKRYTYSGYKPPNEQETP